jgi:transcriptional regulator with XRE-family HTH domain
MSEFRRSANPTQLLSMYRAVRSDGARLTQLQMAEESGLSLSVIEKIARGAEVSQRSATGFIAFAEKVLGRERMESDAATIWSKPFAAFRKEYLWFDQQTDRIFFRWLDTFERLVELLVKGNSLDKGGMDEICAMWLLAWAAHDRAFRGRKPGEHHEEFRQSALSRYERAIGLTADLVASNGQRYVYVLQNLRVSQLATFFNAEPVATRRDDPRVVAWFSDQKIIEAVLEVARVRPHEWTLLRNGLVAASILKDAERCQLFFKLLTAADPRFHDLFFRPNGSTQTLADDPDLEFFRSLNSGI